MDLLKCSLLSKSPLTDLFLGKKPFLNWSWSLKDFSCNVENNSNIQISLNLTIRKSDNKILFAQGEQDFADLLLNFIAFPLGGVIRKLGGKCCIGSIDGLYKSIADLDENGTLMSKEAKKRLVDPHLAPMFKLSKEILASQEPHKFYCHYEGSFGYSSTGYKERIVNNDIFINHEYRSTHGFSCKDMHLVNPKSSIETAEGYFKGPRMYGGRMSWPLHVVSNLSFNFTQKFGNSSK